MVHGSMILGGRREFWWRNRLEKKVGDADGKAGGPSTGDTADGGGGGGTNADTRSHAEGDAFQGSGFQESGVADNNWPSQAEPWSNTPSSSPTDTSLATDATLSSSSSSSSNWSDISSSAADQVAGTGAALGQNAGAVADAGAAAATTVSSVGDLTMWPHHLLMQLLEFIHVTTGIPYWQAIIATTLAARFAVLPLVVSSTAMGARMAAAKPELDPIQATVNEINTRMKAAPDQETKDALLKEMQDQTLVLRAVWKKHDINPVRGLYGFVQMPIFVGLFFATRNMGDFFPGYALGGPDWALDLSAADPTYLMAFFTWATMQALCEMGTGMPPMPGQMINMNLMMRFMGLVSFPITFTMPVGTLMYWSTANLAYIAQRKFFLDVPAVKRYLRIPVPAVVQAPKEAPKYQAPPEAEHASKWQQWRAGGTATGTNDASETEAPDRSQLAREREIVAKEAKERHEALRREHDLKQTQASSGSRPWDEDEDDRVKDKDERRP